MTAVLSSMEPQSLSLLDLPGFHFSPLGLSIDDWVEFPQWERAGRALLIADQGIQWWIGDWLAFGEHKWGEKYAQAVEVTGRKVQTLKNYVFVAENVHSSRRRDDVDFSIHAEVASLPAKEQERILAEAAGDPDATVKQVRHEVDKTKRRLGLKKTEIQVLQEPEVRDFLATYANSVKDWKNSVPAGAGFLKGMFESHVLEIQWQLDRTESGDRATIMQVFDEWERATDGDIFTWLNVRGYFMSDPELEERLAEMACIGHEVEHKEKNCPSKCGKHLQMLLTVSVEESRQENRRGVIGAGELYRVHPAYLSRLG